MNVQTDLQQYLSEAQAGDKNAEFAIRTRILQLHWMGMEREASLLGKKLQAALYDWEPNVLDDH